MTQVDDPRFAAPQEHGAEPTKSGRGCLFWGCLISGVLLLLLVIGLPLAGYFALRYYVQQFTTEEAGAIEIVELPEEELAELTERIAKFGEAVQAKQTPPDLTLTARELNGLIAGEEDLRGRVLLRIEDGQVGGEISLPADQFPGGAGRFLNLSVDFNVSMQNGRLDVRLSDAEWNGSPLPPAVVDTIANENLAAEAYKNPETRDFLALFDSLEVVGDRVVLKAKRPTEETPPAGVDAEIESFDGAADPPPAGAGG